MEIILLQRSNIPVDIKNPPVNGLSEDHNLYIICSLLKYDIEMRHKIIGLIYPMTYNIKKLMPVIMFFVLVIHSIRIVNIGVLQGEIFKPILIPNI